MQGRQATRRRKGIEVVHPREETTWCRKRSSLELQRWWKFPCGPWRINPVSISLRVWKRRNYIYIYRYRYIDIYRYRVSLVAQMVKNLPGMQEIWVRSLGQEDPMEKEMATPPVSLPEKFHGQRSLAGYSPWGRKRVRHDRATHTHTHIICIIYNIFIICTL